MAEEHVTQLLVEVVYSEDGEERSTQALAEVVYNEAGKQRVTQAISEVVYGQDLFLGVSQLLVEVVVPAEYNLIHSHTISPIFIYPNTTSNPGGTLDLMRVLLGLCNVRFSGTIYGPSQVIAANPSLVYLTMNSRQYLRISIDDAPSTEGQYRYDLIVIGPDLVVDVVKGVESDIPTMPYTPSNHLICGWVALSYGMVEIVAADLNKLFDGTIYAEPPLPPVPPVGQEAQIVLPMSTTYFDLAGQTTALFVLKVDNFQYPDAPLQIGLANQYTQNGIDSDMLIKYAGVGGIDGPPTLQDLLDAKAYWELWGAPFWDIYTKTWKLPNLHEPPWWAEDFYYDFAGDSFEFVEIYGNPLQAGWYYILVYNQRTELETYLRLNIGWV